MRLRLNKDIYILTAIIGICIMLYMMADGFPEPAGQYPKGLLVVIIILGIIEIVTKSIRKPRQEQETIQKGLSPKTIRVITLGALCAGYIFSVGILGYFVSTFIFASVAMIFTGMRRWVSIAAIATGINLFVYVFFILLLRISVPQGLFF